MYILDIMVTDTIIIDLFKLLLRIQKKGCDYINESISL